MSDIMELVADDAPERLAATDAAVLRTIEKDERSPVYKAELARIADLIEAECDTMARLEQDLAEAREERDRYYAESCELAVAKADQRQRAEKAEVKRARLEQDLATAERCYEVCERELDEAREQRDKWRSDSVEGHRQRDEWRARAEKAEAERDEWASHAMCEPSFPPETWKLRAERLERELAEAREQKDGAYAERDCLVAALSKVFSAWLGRHPDDDKSWDDDWRWIVFINLPTGQASWHIHDSERLWFDHLEVHEGEHWDGHTTEEKYERLAALKNGCAVPGRAPGGEPVMTEPKWTKDDWDREKIRAALRYAYKNPGSLGFEGSGGIPHGQPDVDLIAAAPALYRAHEAQQRYEDWENSVPDDRELVAWQDERDRLYDEAERLRTESMAQARGEVGT